MTTHDPILVHLFDRLPAEGDVFTTGDRERWIAAMDAALQFLHPPEWSQEARAKAREARTMVTLPDPPPGTRWRRVDLPADPPEEAPLTTFADAVDDATFPAPGGKTTTGVDAAGDTSPDLPAGPDSAPTSPSSGDPAPTRSRQPKGEPVRIAPPRIPPPQEGRKRHFTADQKGAILRRVVREGMPAVQADTMIHESTLNRWMREMPKSVEAFTEEWEAEQREKALAEAAPTVEELEAEKAKPVPAPPKAKPAVQWPSTPIERRPVDHERVRRGQADWA